MSLFYLTHHTSKEYEGFESKEPSMVIEGETQSIEEMIKKNTNEPIKPPEPASYFDEEDLAKINKYFAPGQLDLTDIEELHSKISSMKYSINKALKKQNEEEQKINQQNPNQTRKDLESENKEQKSTDDKNEEN